MQQWYRIFHRNERFRRAAPTRLLLAVLILSCSGFVDAQEAPRPDQTSIVALAQFAQYREADVNSAWSFGNAVTAASPTQYLPYILLGSTALLLQGLLINWLVREREQRRRSEAQTRDTIAQLAHLNRISTAGELSASIAHELTQPITGMVASANAALRWLSSPTPQIDQARSAVTRVISAGDRTTEIIHGVRAMFKREAEERHAIDMNEVIFGVLALVDSDLRNNDIAVETALGEPSAPVTGDHVQLQQVVLNLTVNAIAAMSAVKARARSLRVRTSYTRDRVWISVADEGTGISREEMNEIFKPLYTTKPQGMGMGLSICRSIVEAHNGRIWVSPGEPYGAVFHFVLPVS